MHKRASHSPSPRVQSLERLALAHPTHVWPPCLRLIRDQTAPHAQRSRLAEALQRIVERGAAPHVQHIPGLVAALLHAASARAGEGDGGSSGAKGDVGTGGVEVKVREERGVGMRARETRRLGGGGGGGSAGGGAGSAPPRDAKPPSASTTPLFRSSALATAASVVAHARWAVLPRLQTLLSLLHGVLSMERGRVDSVLVRRAALQVAQELVVGVARHHLLPHAAELRRLQVVVMVREGPHVRMCVSSHAVRLCPAQDVEGLDDDEETRARASRVLGVLEDTVKSQLLDAVAQATAPTRIRVLQ